MPSASPPIQAERLRLSVAPMMDWTDSHCRAFHRVLAPHARLYTEMVHANAVIHGDRAKLLAMDPSEHPVALQLGGSEPELLAQAARIGADAGFDEINLNCGCPSDRVQAGRFGACLMREPRLVADSVAAMIEACNVPVTVKCRLGVDDDHDWDRFAAFVDAIAAAGCRMFVVHARNAWLKGLSPKENREVPPLRYDWAYRLKAERPQLQVIVNGGIADATEATAHLAHVDGAMLGRAAYENPGQLLAVDPLIFDAPPPAADLAAALEPLFPYIEQAMSEGARLNSITRHLLGLFRGQPGARSFRRHLAVEAVKPDADMAVLRVALALVLDSKAELAQTAA
jgi:tRNA-dihydrouridine synthase A